MVPRDHPSCALLAGVAVRLFLFLERATWHYSTVGLVLGALVWDLDESRSRFPCTVAASLLVPPTWFVDADDLRSAMQVLAALGALALVGVDRHTNRSISASRRG